MIPLIRLIPAAFAAAALIPARASLRARTADSRRRRRLTASGFLVASIYAAMAAWLVSA